MKKNNKETHFEAVGVLVRYAAVVVDMWLTARLIKVETLT